MPNYTKVGHSKLDFLFYLYEKGIIFTNYCFNYNRLNNNRLNLHIICSILYVELYDQVGHFNVCKPMTKCGTPYTIHESIS